MAPTETSSFHSISTSISSLFSLIPPRHIAFLLVAYAVFWIANRYIIQPRTSSIRNLDGPRRKGDWNPWVGHLRPIIKGLPGEAAAKWIEEFGTVFREASRVCFSDEMTIDRVYLVIQATMGSSE